MLRSLNARLIISYIVIILVCLALVGLGLLLFVRASPLWTRPTNQRLEEAERATMRLLLQNESLQTLRPERSHQLLTQAAQEHQVRILLLDNKKQVRFDTGESWRGHDFSELIRPQEPSPQQNPPRFQGTFVGPDGLRWLFIAQAHPGAEGQRLTLVFTSRPSRLLILAWFAENLLPPLFQAGIVAFFLSILLALLISYSVSRPLRRMAGAVQAVARGEVDARAPISGPREVQTLARTFNIMADRVETTQQSQRDFVANVSHELKTPLTSIQGFSQALLDGTASTPETTARAANVIHQEAGRMRRMVDDLLLLARFDAGQMTLARDPVQIGPLLQGSVEKLTPQAQSAGVSLTLPPPERLVVTGDADRLAQVFTNLLDNALAHTPAEGRVTIGTQRIDDTIEVIVTDTGEGIPAEMLPRIFERFYQVDKARGRARGAGLGLAITKEIVEAHGGTITAESVVGLGSKFTVRLPAREETAGSTVAQKKASPS
jgi:signal transduction histidine kinase